jgi:hypothetical protein
VMQQTHIDPMQHFPSKVSVENKAAMAIAGGGMPFPLPNNPTWDRAKLLAGRIRGGAEAIVELGLELVALKRQFNLFGVGGDRKSSAYKNHSPQGAANDRKGLSDYEKREAQKGWQQAVREHLGISDDTARRWMERAVVIMQFQQLKAGQAIEYSPAGKKNEPPRLLEPTPEVLDRIDEALDNIVTGAVAAPRAFAGVIGESIRRTKQGGTAKKAPTDHAANIRTALTKLETSLSHWRKLDAETRMELETQWEAVRAKLPDTWIQE